MKVLIRADASRALGTGHVMRELALATALQRRGAHVTFASRAIDGTAANLVRDAFTAIEIPLGDDGDEAADFAATASAAGRDYDWVVVDHYRLGAIWEREARALAPRVLAVDDLADRRHACDVLVDQNLYADADIRYANLLDTECTTLLGPAYAFLRDEFGRAREGVHPRSGKVKRVHVSFGGSDPAGQTLIAMEALAALRRSDFAIDIVVGPANRDGAAIAARAKSLAGATCHLAPPHVATLMGHADLALGAGGVSTNERMCLGLPAAVVATNALAEQSARDVDRAGAHRYLGSAPSMSPALYAAAIEQLIATPAALRSMSETGMRLVDGRGSERVADAMMMGTRGIEPRQKLV